MEPQDLALYWHDEPKYPLTPKQLSIRLPIDVAAKVAALCEIYPTRTKTEIIADLGPILGVEPPVVHQRLKLLQVP